MNTPMIAASPRRARGASIVTVLVALAIVVGIAVAAWFLVIHPHRQATQAQAPVVQAGKRPARKVAPPVDVAAMSTSEILAEASKAIKEQRLLAPEGNNAFALYLKALEREPDNQVARDALRETFPFAANAAEQVINRGDFAQAEREIALLAKADPNNYTLTILRSKLDARRKVRVKEQQAKQLAAQQADARKAAAAAAARQAELAKQKAAEVAANKAAVAKAAQQSTSEQVATQEEPAAAPEQAQRPKVVIQGAVRVRQVKPRYPRRAARMRRQGWVEVEFTVGADGQVRDAHAVASNPAHVFDHAAVEAVSQWEYKPALRNGTPMPVTMRKKIVFTL